MTISRSFKTAHPRAAEAGSMSQHHAPPGTRKDRNLWPGLTSTDPLALRRWLTQLGFTEGNCYFETGGEGDTTKVMHSEMLWPEGGRVMISSAARGEGTFTRAPGSGNVYVVTEDPDTVHGQAVAQEATFLRPMREEDYGSRGFSVADPDGNAWSFGTYAG